MSKRLSWLSLALSGTLVTCPANATWAPRVTLLGEMGQYGSLWADGLFPVQDISNQVIFFDFQAEANRFYSGDSFSGILSPGFGVRHAFSDDKVFGFYLFSDYLITDPNQDYWLLSPGIDFYRGPLYAALNGYFPVNNAPREAGSPIPASEAGIAEHVTLSGNSYYDHLVESYYTLRWGMDLTGGGLLGSNNEWDVKLGAYYYDSEDVNSIIGGRAELNYYFNDSVALILEDRYDNVFHNQTLVGIKINLLGKDNRGTVATQLKAPIYRNLNINTTSAGTAIGEYQQISSGTYLIQDNIIFVSNGPIYRMQSGTISGDGTFENPYMGLDQDVINMAGVNTDIWVEGTGAGLPYSNAATLTLQTGQSLSGRTDGFILPALSAGTQPIFNFAPTAGTSALYIDNTNTLQNFIMYGNGSADSIGVQVENTGSGTAIIDGVTIGTTNTSMGYGTALYSQGGSVSINDAILYATEDTVAVSNTGPSAQGVFGIYNNGGTVVITDSIISATANTVNYTFNAVGTGISAGSWGIYNALGGVVTIGQSTVDASANHVNYNAGSSTAGGDFVGAFGLYNSEGTVTLSDSTVQATANNVVDNREPASGAFSVIGAFGLYNSKGTMTVTGSSSLINATAINVDNIGFDAIASQALLDFVGAFGTYNDGGGNGNTATLDIQQAQVTTSATTVSLSAFSLNDPSVTAIGVWNNGNGGIATTRVEQGANVDLNTTWQISSTFSSGSAVNAFGLYNQGGVDSSAHEGTGYLTIDSATITVTETGGDTSGSGVAIGVQNGSFNVFGNSAVTVVRGPTTISVSSTSENVGVYGFQNTADFESTTGTTIEGGVTINSEGGNPGTSTAVYNTLGDMTIQGTADENVILIANGGGSNTGVWNDNNGNISVNYATISVGPASIGGYSVGVNNSSHNAITVQDISVTVASSGSHAYGVYNSGSGSMVNISASAFSVSSSDVGVAYGLWDQGSGITITSPTALNFNYDPILGDAFAFSTLGSYSGQSNVTCRYNGTPGTCNTD